MKKILYYITDHGRGHATRSVAIIRKLESLGFEIIIRNSNVVDFLTKSLPKTQIISGQTDIGPEINDDGISIKQNDSVEKIGSWIQNVQDFVEKEIFTVQKTNPDLIISDISVVPFLAAEKTSKKSVAISNFTWYDVLKFLSEENLEFIKKAYDYADFAIQLPLGTTMDHFRKKIQVGYVSRKPTKNRVEVRHSLGIKDSEHMVTFAMGGSNKKIKSNLGNNIKIVSMSSSIDDSLNPINVTDWIEGQNIIHASDLVFCKCGYGLITECLTSGTSFCYFADNNHLEQRAISNELERNQWGKRLSLDEIDEIMIDENFIQSIPKPESQFNDVDNIVKYIINQI